MSWIRRPTLVLGLASSLVGILLITSPTLANIGTLTGVARAAPFVIIGLGAVILAGYLLIKNNSATDTGNGQQVVHGASLQPENRPRYERPGTSFARRLAGIDWSDRRMEDPESRLALRAELREIAISVLSRTETWTRTEIETRLDDGSWTDDSRAASFFEDDVVPRLSLRQRLRSLRSTEPPFARRARHAMADLASRFDGTSVSPELFDATKRSLDQTPITTTREYWSSIAGENSQVSRPGRTRGVTAAALVAGGVGIFTVRPGLLLLALFGITIAGYTRVATPPSKEVEITRTISDPEPDVGDGVTVTVSIKNTGNSTLADLRLIDGVPVGLTVTDGSPRFTTALRPGKRATFTYSVTAVSGIHTFDPSLVIMRDVTGVQKRELLVESTANEINCLVNESPESEVSLPRETTVHSGQARATVSGSGVEFHSVREYRSGDSLSRIDWKRMAKTGELRTVDFRESRLTKVMVVIDARTEAYLAPLGASDEPIVQQSVTAGRYITTQLLSESIPVGVTALSPESCWLSPGAGASQRSRIHRTLAEETAFAWDTPNEELDVTAAIQEFHQRIRSDIQVILISPMCDDEAKHAARRLDAFGYAVTVVSPNPTIGEPSADCADGFASLTRRFRLGDLRSAGIPVVDWNVSEPIEEVFRYAP